MAHYSEYDFLVVLFSYALRSGGYGGGNKGSIFLISQLMVNCLLAFFGLVPSLSAEQIGVPPFTVAMTTAGTSATGGKFSFFMV